MKLCVVLFFGPVVRGSGLSAGISSSQIELLSRVGVIAAEFSYALLVSVYRINAVGDLPGGALEELDLADAIIYGSPTYMGGPAWQFKKFADSSAKAFFARKWEDKLAAGFTNSASINGDKYSTIQYFWTLSQQHGQLWIGTGLLPANMKANVPADVNWTAGFAGALAVSPSDASPDEAPQSGDLETAKLLGRRVAELATRSREVVHGVIDVPADL